MPFNRPIPEQKQPRKYPSALATLMEAEKMMQIAILLPSAAFIGEEVPTHARDAPRCPWVVSLAICEVRRLAEVISRPSEFSRACAPAHAWHRGK